MKLPVIQGVIRRRILANFRVDASVMQQQLPARFQPKLQQGFAVAGICLIRLEHVRPKFVPQSIGLNSENAAHRVAVLWEEDGETREGVFISRRDTDSQLNLLLGGRIFPGEQNQASFNVRDTESEIDLSLESTDGKVVVRLEGNSAAEIPATSIFSSLAETSTFFEGGSLGYSVTHDAHRLDGLKLKTEQWQVKPLEIKSIYSSYFSDEQKFPAGSIDFDHALIMRNVEHEWYSADDLFI
jgi:hypothetical protein